MPLRARFLDDAPEASPQPREPQSGLRARFLDPPERTPLGWGEALTRSVGEGAVGSVGATAEGAGLIAEQLGAPETGQALYRAGRDITDFGRRIGPEEHYRGLATDIAGGVGSMGTYLVPGGAATALTRGAGTLARGAAGIGAASTMAGPAGAAEAYQRAIEGGLTDEDAVETAMQGIPAGIVQVAPVAVILRRVPPEVRGRAVGQLRHIAEAFGAEFTAEGAGAVLQNLVEQSYNPERGTWDDSLYRAAIGGSAGALIQLGIQVGTRGRGAFAADTTGRRLERPTDDARTPEEGAAEPVATAAVVDAARPAGAPLDPTVAAPTAPLASPATPGAATFPTMPAPTFDAPQQPAALPREAVVAEVQRRLAALEGATDPAAVQERQFLERAASEPELIARLLRGEVAPEATPAAPAQAPAVPAFVEHRVREAAAEQMQPRPAVAGQPFASAPTMAAQGAPAPADAPAVTSAPTTTFDPLQHVPALQAYVRGTRRSLAPEAVARHLGITPGEARRVLGSLAAQRDSGLMQDRSGRLRRRPVREGPVDAATFIAEAGGVRESAHVSRDRHQRFVPGAGMLVRREGGQSLDQIGERLWEAGYFGPMETMPRPTEAQVVDLLEELARGRRIFRAEDAVVVTERDGAQADAEAEGQAREEIQAVASEIGETLTDAEVDAIMQSMAEEGLSAEAATENFIERRAFADVEAAAEETQDGAYTEAAQQAAAGPDVGEGVAGRAGELAAPVAGAPVGQVAARARFLEEAEGREVDPGAAADERFQAGRDGETLQNITGDAEARGVRLDVTERANGDVVLNRIDTTAPGRGEGVGTEFMQRLTAWADREGRRLLLTPDATVGATSRRRLVDFYRRFGFVENRGRNRDFEISEGMYRPPAERARVADATTLTIADDGRRAAWYDALRQALDDMGLADVALETPRDMRLSDGRQVTGRFVPGLIQVSQNALAPANTLRHEAVHAMRQLGLFTPSEWRTLAAASDRSWRRQYGIATRYEGQPADIQREEGVAEAFADWRIGRLQVGGAVRQAFEKMRRFLERLANALRGRGFQTAEDVFGRMESGEVGARARRGDAAPEAFQARADVTETPEFRRWFGDSKVVDGQGRPLVVYHGSPSAEAVTESNAILSPDRAGQRTDFGNFGVGVYTTPKDFLARSYAGRKGAVLPLYAAIQNPLRIPVTGAEYTDYVTRLAESLGVTARPKWEGSGQKNRAWSEQFREKAIEAGYDGVITENIDGSMGAEVVAFRPEQIKSATENVGTFDPADPRIRYQIPPDDRAGNIGGPFDPSLLGVDQGETARFEQHEREAAARIAESILGRRIEGESADYDVDADGLPDPGSARIDPGSRRLMRGDIRIFFESATDKLRLSGHPRLVDLATRTDRYFDQREARVGWVNGRVRPMLRELGMMERRRALEAFRDYWQNHDNGRRADAEAALAQAPEPVRRLVEEVKDIYSDVGDINQTVGVQVFDAKLGRFRPIGKVPRGQFWPRQLRPEVQRVLQNPHNDSALWNEMVDALIDGGHIESRAEADRYLQTYFSREITDDYFAGIEKARAEKLPEIFYDYSWDAFQRYAWKWSGRVSQIEQFGQVTQPGGKDAFDAVIESTLDEGTRQFVAALSDRVYNRRPNDAYLSLLNNLNILATAIQLGNPATATLNLIGGTTLNVQQFGVRRVGRAYLDLLTEWKTHQQRGAELGILEKDVLNILRDTERSAAEYMDTEGRVRDTLAGFARTTMTWGGYRGTENVIRATAMLAARGQLNDALRAWNADPSSAVSKSYRAFMERNRIDPDLLLAEHGAGPETSRYLRLMVNIPQGSYRVDQTPIFVDSPVGRFLFKYQKFGTQVSRMFWQQFLQPFVKAETGAERARAFLPLLRYFAAAFVGGSAILSARAALFNYLDPGPEWDDLVDALEDDERANTWVLIADRIWYSSLAASALGFFGNYIQFGLDVADQQRVKNPLEPPGLASIDAGIELVQRFIEQGKLTARDLDQIGERTLALYRGYKRMGLSALDVAGSELRESKLQAARRDVNYIRKTARRYADEAGIAQRRTISGRVGRTPMSPTNAAIGEALLLGDAETARALVQEAMREAPPEERGNIRASMQASARARHPILIAGSPSREERANFLRWARGNVSKANYQRIVETARRYDRATARAGL